MFFLFSAHQQLAYEKSAPSCRCTIAVSHRVVSDLLQNVLLSSTCLVFYHMDTHALREATRVKLCLVDFVCHPSSVPLTNATSSLLLHRGCVHFVNPAFLQKGTLLGRYELCVRVCVGDEYVMTKTVLCRATLLTSLCV